MIDDNPLIELVDELRRYKQNAAVAHHQTAKRA